MNAFHPDEGRNARIQLGFEHGLFDEVVGPRSQAIKKVLLVARRGQDDDRQLGSVGDGAHEATCFFARDLGHMPIEHENIWPVPGGEALDHRRCSVK